MSRSPLIHAARRTLSEAGVCPGEAVVVGLSGGADSLALLDVLAQLAPALGVKVVAAHLDHGLREDSRQDAAHCAELAGFRGLAFESERVDVRGRARGRRGGLELAAREERYAFLQRVKARHAAQWIAVGHTRDDQAETLLLHLLRGAGLAGLRGMRPVSGVLLRPWLGVARAQVVAYLTGRGLAWREDPSNTDCRLRRNRVRHELLPLIETRFNPAGRAALARSAALLADDEAVLRTLVAEAHERARLSAEPGSAALGGAALRALPRALARGVVRRALAEAGGLAGVAAVHVERLLDLVGARASSGRSLALPGGRQARLRFGDLHVGPALPPGGPYAFTLRVPGRFELPGGALVVERAAGGPAVSNETMAVLPLCDAVPLALRTRLPGDRVRARGRERSLKRFLMERRVPAELRASLPLVAAGSRVLWVAGQRLDPPGDRPGTPWARIEMLAGGTAGGAA